MGKEQDFVTSRTERGLPESVFLDPRKRRAGRLRGFIFTSLAILTTWIGVFLSDLYFGGVWTSPAPKSLPLKIELPTGENWSLATAHAGHDHGSERPEPIAGIDCGALPQEQSRMTTYSVAPSEPHSIRRAEQHCKLTDVLLPEWLTVREKDGNVDVDLVIEMARRPVTEAQRRDTKIIPMVQFAMSAEKASGIAAHKYEALAPKLRELVRQEGWAGYCVDLSWAASLPRQRLASLYRAFFQSGDPNGMSNCIALGPGTPSNILSVAGAQLEHVIIQAFSQPWLGSLPGPASTDQSVRDIVRKAKTYIPTEKLVIGLGTGAVAWIQGAPMPEKVPFAEAFTRMELAGVTPRHDIASGNSYGEYRNDSGRLVQIWLQDALTTERQIEILEREGIDQIAIWGMGNEDPGVWPMLAQSDDQLLEKIIFDNYVHTTGAGPFVLPTQHARTGHRNITRDKLGRVIDVEYTQLPRAESVHLYGQADPNQVVLSFDDGPDPAHTPAILDLLREHGIAASFFVLGQNAGRHHELMLRLLNEGHEIGSHTFWHPKMQTVSKTRAKFEVTSTAMAITGATGREARLYREPFMRTGGPKLPEEVASLRLLAEAGYLIAGMGVSGNDWSERSADEIAEGVIADVRDGKGNVILLHDGGGDKATTVEALPRIIETLKADGYEFTTMGELIDLDPQILMPPAPEFDAAFRGLSFKALHSSTNFMEIAFWTVLALGSARAVFLMLMACFRKRHKPFPQAQADQPWVTVAIPAYNEASVIGACLESVLKSDYPKFEVLVVDDGSQDDTYEIARTYCRDPRVKVIHKRNGGKATALNCAIAESAAEVVVCIDADTQMDRHAISRLVPHFSDPKVGAVAGKIVVGNRKGLLPNLQALEYLTAQSVERRAKEVFNGIPVVPGALGAWRASAVIEAGVFSKETLTEDADQTMAVIRSGYSVVYEERAVAVTEAPVTLKALMTQRLRWSLGMLQAGWKHKGAASEGRGLGLFSIPDLAVFGCIFPLLAPLADLFLLTQLAQAMMSLTTGTGDLGDTPTYLGAYLMLPLLEVMLILLAFRFDRSEEKRLLIYLPLQRLFYRQVLYYSVYRALWRAASGRLAEWGKLQRRGFVFTGRLRTA